MSAAAAVIAAQAAKRRKLIRHFTSCGAVTPERAIAKETLPQANSRVLDHLQRARIICTDATGKLYLDEHQLEVIDEARHDRLAKVLPVIVLAILAATIYGVMAAR